MSDELREMFPFYHLVPKDPIENMRFRREILTMAAKSPEFAADVREMCRRDCLFWLNTFGWTMDPRAIERGLPSALPMITYPYQDLLVMEQILAIREGYDLPIAKSRDMGATWILLDVRYWFWSSVPDYHSLLVSRKEELVDSKKGHKPLFKKLDWQWEREPRWLRPKRDRQMLVMENLENGSTISGESTNPDTGRGDRQTDIMVDEYAAFGVNDSYEVQSATRDVTRSRTFNSTPKGPIGAFADQYLKKAKRKVRLHWTLHPEKNRGTYKWEPGGTLEIIRPFCGRVRVSDDGDGYRYVWFPHEYPFRQDGKLRSPWYDAEEDRCASAVEAAQEMDIDFGGSVSTFFDASELDRLIAKDARAPLTVGDLDYSINPVKQDGFVPTPGGRLSLWIRLIDGEPPRDRNYKIGLDAATGTGTSNSVANVYDGRTHEKVAAFVSPHITPTDFAHMAMALGQFFEGVDGLPAEINYEKQGPGGTLTKEFLSEKYPNLHYEVEDTGKKRKKATAPGWHSTRDAKRVMLERYRRDLYRGIIRNPCAESLNDCRGYVYQNDGSIEHVNAANAVDPSGAKANHGDRTMADALATHMLVIEKKPDAPPDETPYMSPAYRYKMHADHQSENRRWDEGW